MVLTAGLVLVLLSENALGDSTFRAAFTGIGVALVLAAAARDFLAWRRDRGRVSTILAATSAGCGLALAGFLAATENGSDLIGLDFESEAAFGRYSRTLLTLSTMAMAIGLLPALATRWARARTQAEGVVQVATAALATALAGSTLTLVGYLASEKDIVIDFSYFKTAMPGEAVVNLAEAMDEPLEATLFFPEVDPVKDEVLRYFRELQREVPSLEIQVIDRFADPRVAERYRIARDWMIVLAPTSTSDGVDGATDADAELGRHERIGLPETLDEARGNLRIFDGFVHEALSKLTRRERVAYLTAGHGELSDGSAEGRDLATGPESFVETDPESELPLAELRRLLAALNYETRDLGVRQGLAEGVPEDAAILLVIGPERPFLDEEAASVREYLARGGSALFAVEPDSDFELAPFAALLGVDVASGTVADEETHGRRRGGRADRSILVTDRILAHPSVNVLFRSGIGTGVLFDGSGHLDMTSTSRTDDRTVAPQVFATVHALSSSFVDLDRDLDFDGEAEAREGITLVAATEAAYAPTDDSDAATAAKTDDTFRAIVYADAAPFTDEVLRSLAPNAAMVTNNLSWLGREEELAGLIVSEEDVPVLHARAEDLVWFQLVIFGVPLTLLTVGIALTVGRRKSEG